MVQIHPLVLVVLGEAAALLGIALAVCTVVFLLRRRRDKRAVAALVAAAQAQAETRRQRTRAYLEGLGLTGAGLEDAQAAIETEETRFLRDLIRTYRRRDTAAVASLLDAVDALVAPYRSLPAPAASASPEPDGGALPQSPEPPAPEDSAPENSALGVDAELVAKLERENTELAAELEAIRDDLDRILGQYAELLAIEDMPAARPEPAAAAIADDIVVSG